ncbi:double-strand break repair protein AddB [Methylopila jiangsuensis]|uniref:Double-strand break repair protein AddB n=1 Tax=Methylopila jiangsuensis TaxID=586230 RepID=A0A9W6JFW7_9HYPH|nr:double-strand break repair protein AddB [Methylopila jiangsuensis]MDR6284185.1 ATP-dependent helicase/nuclease subunit B [Methylopila jiangsuensis]GLK76297.1 double-strand break repair protein AddB [Methylopila jiangsuensis]
MAARRPNVLTIPPGAAFLPTLARALLDGDLIPGFAPRHDPLALASATLFLPTRRAGRALRDAFLAELDGRAALLPRIAPLGDVDEDSGLADAPDEGEDDLPPAVAPLERRLTLARLVSRFAATLDRSVLNLDAKDGPLIPATAAEAIHLAGDLEALVDSVETEEADLTALDRLAPGEHDRYWAITQSFLQVALRAWPEHLSEIGRLDPARRRRLQIDAAAARVARGSGPVVAAGSTGSVPATRRLIRAIAEADQGAVVLPGLDRDGLEPPAWHDLLRDDEPALQGHPQRGLALLLRDLGLSRAEVRELGEAAPALAARARLVADALRPAATTDMWARAPRSEAERAAALSGVTLVAAPHVRGEATAVALSLREALETPGATAALVTPDRALAARVAVELERWGVAVDDSAGVALAVTRAGGLLRLVAEAALAPKPAALLALLRHPACRLAQSADLNDRAVDALDLMAFRAPLPGEGFAGLARALETVDPRGPARRLSGAARASAHALLAALTAALAPLAALKAETEAPLSAFVAALVSGYAALAGEAETEDHAEAVRFLEELSDAAPASDPISALSFPGVLAALMGGRVVRPPRPRHPRLHILGPLEARLLAFHRVALGGLNDGVWPPAPQSDAWINRPLRAQLGLPAPERRIGLSAHDFEQGLGAREVVLTRARKAGGAPTIPSRWLQRLEAAAGGPAFAAALARGERLVRLTDALDETPPPVPAAAPEPRPPLDLRPTRLSVTGVETWLRDPYAIYARHILKLDEIGPVGPEPGPGELGNAIHGALELFAASGLNPAHPDAREALLGFGRAAFGPLLERDEAQTLWWPRFVRIADWLLKRETERGPRVAARFVERAGAVLFRTGAGRDFELTARADRIDLMTDGSAALIDYKTGRVATKKQALAGFAPQLPLEAAILRQGGFPDVAAEGVSVESLSLLRLTGRDPAGEEIDIRHKDKPLDQVADEAFAAFRAVVDRFENPDEPYRSLSHPQFLARPEGPYGHLARVREWSATGGADEDGGAEE